MTYTDAAINQLKQSSERLLGPILSVQMFRWGLACTLVRQNTVKQSRLDLTIKIPLKNLTVRFEDYKQNKNKNNNNENYTRLKHYYVCSVGYL